MNCEPRHCNSSLAACRAAKLPECQSPRMPGMAYVRMCLCTRQGVCVAAYGADEFPAFFARASGCRAPARVDSPAQAAALVKAAVVLRLAPEPSHCSGVVIGAQAQAVADRSRCNGLACARYATCAGAGLRAYLLPDVLVTLSKYRVCA